MHLKYIDRYINNYVNFAFASSLTMTYKSFIDNMKVM